RRLPQSSQRSSDDPLPWPQRACCLKYNICCAKCNKTGYKCLSFRGLGGGTIDVLISDCTGGRAWFSAVRAALTRPVFLCRAMFVSATVLVAVLGLLAGLGVPGG